MTKTFTVTICTDNLPDFKSKVKELAEEIGILDIPPPRDWKPASTNITLEQLKEIMRAMGKSKIEGIKTIRAYTGLGLKESKEVFELAIPSNLPQ